MKGRMDVEDTNFQNISPFSMTFDDYICPITAQYFFDPQQVLPCGHIFESQAIQQWLKDTPENQCPCCREKITKIFPAPHYFKKHYAELLEKKLDLHGERYFDWGSFIASLAIETEFNKYIELFKKSVSHLNAIQDEKKSDKHSVLSILAENQKGREILEQLQNNLIPDALNHVNIYGESAIYFLIKFNSSIVMNPYFYEKISEESLNGILTRKDESSILFLLTQSEKGRELLIGQPKLRSKISEEALNHVITAGPFKGSSPLFELLQTKEGLALIKNDAELCAKISADGLNSIIESGENLGISAVYWLTNTEENIEFLTQQPVLRAKISRKGLNATFQTGENQGVSPLFCLTKFENGIKLLEDDAKLREKISILAFNSVILQGETPGVTAFYQMVMSDDGFEILKKDKKLLAKVTEAGMNSYPIVGENNGITAAVWLIVSDEGLALLNKYPKLRKKINSEGMNTVEQGQDNGATGVYWLMKQKGGRQILRKDARLRGLINQDSLHLVIVEGDDKGKSAAFWLKKYGQGILKLDSGLRKKLKIEEKVPLSQFFKKGKRKNLEVKENKSRKLTRKK